MAAHDAWALVCPLFAGNTPVLRTTLSPREASALSVLGKAVKPTVVDQSFVLCPHCQQHRAQVWGDGRGGRVCRCPDMGPAAGEEDGGGALVPGGGGGRWTGRRGGCCSGRRLGCGRRCASRLASRAATASMIWATAYGGSAMPAVSHCCWPPILPHAFQKPPY